MKFDADKKGKFLGVLWAGGTVTEACHRAEIGRTTAYDAKDSDPQFSRSWDEAKEAQADVLIAEVRRRALDAEDSKSHTLLMFLLKALKPEFRDNYKTEVKVSHDHVQDVSFSKEEWDAAVNFLTEAKGDAS